MHITSQTAVPLSIYGRVRIDALSGKFRAIVVQRNFYENNPSGVAYLLNNAPISTDFVADATTPDEQLVILAPYGQSAHVNIVSGSGIVGQPMLYNNYDFAETFKSWWDKPAYRYSMIAGGILLVLLIIWLIWYLMKKRSGTTTATMF